MDEIELSMHAKLFCKTGQLAGANYTISGEATIGKGPENTIQLYPSLVSGRHARIFFDKKAGAFLIEDLRSRNGTKVDGVKVIGKEKLSTLHIITFAGQFDFIFQVSSGEPEVASPAARKKPQPAVQSSSKQSPPKSVPQDQKTVVDAGFDVMPKLGETSKPVPADVNKTVIGEDFQPPPQIPTAAQEDIPAVPPSPPSVDAVNKTIIGDDFLPMPGIPPASGRPPVQTPKVEEVKSASASEFYLEFKDLPGGLKSFKLMEGENIIGRESGCTIQIEDGSLSRKHAVLIVSAGVVMMKDLGSKNHTFLENQKLNYEVEIRGGANLMFGMVKAMLVKK